MLTYEERVVPDWAEHWLYADSVAGCRAPAVNSTAALREFPVWLRWLCNQGCCKELWVPWWGTELGDDHNKAADSLVCPQLAGDFVEEGEGIGAGPLTISGP